MTARKIIQIAVAGLPDGDVLTFALCDDGTVWDYDFRRIHETGTPWKKREPIPQEAA
jgi:hypothetical protein